MSENSPLDSKHIFSCIVSSVIEIIRPIVSLMCRNCHESNTLASLQVVGGCNRCQMVNIDQSSGLRESNQPLATLASYRRHKVSVYSLCFPSTFISSMTF